MEKCMIWLDVSIYENFQFKKWSWEGEGGGGGGQTGWHVIRLY